MEVVGADEKRAFGVLMAVSAPRSTGRQSGLPALPFLGRMGQKRRRGPCWKRDWVRHLGQAAVSAGGALAGWYEAKDPPVEGNAR